ncbi:MAG: transposase [Treponema sp.]|nr:transposase [Treponema sp.]
MRAAYPSGITREQFSVMEYEPQPARKVTRPRTCDLYGLFCAILYALKEGCAWRGLPHGIPHAAIARYGARKAKTAKPRFSAVYYGSWRCQSVRFAGGRRAPPWQSWIPSA